MSSRVCQICNARIPWTATTYYLRLGSTCPVTGAPRTRLILYGACCLDKTERLPKLSLDDINREVDARERDRLDRALKFLDPILGGKE